MTSAITEEEWNFLRQGIVDVLEKAQLKEPLKKEYYMKLYTDVHKLCTDKKSEEQVYKSLTVDEYLSEKILPILKARRGSELIDTLIQQWTIHIAATKTLSNIFRYAERLATAKQPHLSSLGDATLNSFRMLVVLPIINEIRNYTLKVIEEVRNQTNEEKLKTITDIVTLFTQLVLYERELEDEIVQNAVEYYRSNKGLKFTNIEKAEDLVKIEENIAEKCFPQTTTKRLLTNAYDILLGKKYNPS